MEKDSDGDCYRATNDPAYTWNSVDCRMTTEDREPAINRGQLLFFLFNLKEWKIEFKKWHVTAKYTGDFAVKFA